MDAAGDLAHRRSIGAALGFLRAGLAGPLAGSIDDGVLLGNPGARIPKGTPVATQGMASGATIFVGLGIPDKLALGEGAILAHGTDLSQTGTCGSIPFSDDAVGSVHQVVRGVGKKGWISLHGYPA